MIDKTIQIGDKFYDLHKRKHHIVNLFKDGEKEIVTYKFWGKRKQRWLYQSDYKKLFLIAFEYGYEWI
jgi:hypothetical protein